MTAAVTILDDQLRLLGERYPDLQVTLLPSGTRLVTIGRVLLPKGWSQEATSVRFLVPFAYPMAAPDCFWTEPGLRLADGRAPQNTGVNPIPEVNAPGLWFSWHVAQNWRPSTGTLSGWMSTVNERFGRLC